MVASEETRLLGTTETIGNRPTERTKVEQASYLNILRLLATAMKYEPGLLELWCRLLRIAPQGIVLNLGAQLGLVPRCLLLPDGVEPRTIVDVDVERDYLGRRVACRGSKNFPVIDTGRSERDRVVAADCASEGLLRVVPRECAGVVFSSNLLTVVRLREALELIKNTKATLRPGGIGVHLITIGDTTEVTINMLRIRARDMGLSENMMLIPINRDLLLYPERVFRDSDSTVLPSFGWDGISVAALALDVSQYKAFMSWANKNYSKVLGVFPDIQNLGSDCIGGIKALSKKADLDPLTKLLSSGGTDVTLVIMSLLFAKWSKEPGVALKDLNIIDDTNTIRCDIYQRSANALGIEWAPLVVPFSYTVGDFLDRAAGCSAFYDLNPGLQAQINGTSIVKDLLAMALRIPGLTEQFGDIGINLFPRGDGYVLGDDLTLLTDYSRLKAGALDDVGGVVIHGAVHGHLLYKPELFETSTEARLKAREFASILEGSADLL